MIERTADANWKGSLKKGHGLTSTESRVLVEQRFDYGTRFEDKKGTNPEELIAAAAASCFSMALAKKLEEEGYEPTELHVRARLGLEVDSEGAFISKLHLDVEGLVPGIGKEEFSDAAEQTKEECPVFQLLVPGLDDAELSAHLQD